MEAGGCRVVLKKGDITLEDVDAVVNAANSGLMGGGGVDGAIHRRGGPAILEACKEQRRRLGGRLPTGGAVITTGGDLPARHVIHTVGPIFRRDPDPDGNLARAYRTSLELAARHGLRSVAFPSISTGAYGFPIQRAARIALGTVTEWLRSQDHGLHEVRFVLFAEGDLSVYEEALSELEGD